MKRSRLPHSYVNTKGYRIVMYRYSYDIPIYFLFLVSSLKKSSGCSAINYATCKYAEVCKEIANLYIESWHSKTLPFYAKLYISATIGVQQFCTTKVETDVATKSHLRIKPAANTVAILHQIKMHTFDIFLFVK